MFRPSLRVLVAAMMAVIACGSLLLRADQASPDKADIQGFPRDITVYLKANGTASVGTLALQQVLTKSLGGRIFLVGTLTTTTDTVAYEQRVWVAMDEVRQIREQRENVRPVVPPGGEERQAVP